MGQARSYDKEYKEQVVKLAKARGPKNAAMELGIPVNTLSGWVHKAKNGKLDIRMGEQTPESALTLVAENEELRRQLKEKAKEIKRLNESGGGVCFFRSEPSEVGKIKQLKFIAQKTKDGVVKGKISFYCETLKVSRQAF